MARRRKTMTIGEYSWVLENADEAVQGEAAGFDTGTNTVRPMGSSVNQIFLGFFAETLTGDGTKKVRVTIPGELEAEWLANSGTDAVAGTDLGSDCFAEDAKTVAATDATGTLSKMGRVLDVNDDASLVLVQTYPAV